MVTTGTERISMDFPVDYCIVVTNDNETLHLIHHLMILCKFFGLSPNIHVIDKGNSAERDRFYRAAPVTVHRIPVYAQPAYGGVVSSCGPAYDLANSYDYALTSCGTEPLCILAHPDVLLLGPDLIVKMFDSVANDVGVVGSCNQVILIRREAYRQCPIKFWPMMSILGVLREEPSYESYRIQCTLDSRDPGSRRIMVHGLDVGELFICMVQHIGWRYVPWDPRWVGLTHHVGAGSGHCLTEDPDVFVEKREVSVNIFNDVVENRVFTDTEGNKYTLWERMCDG